MVRTRPDKGGSGSTKEKRNRERFLIQTRVFAGQRGGKFFPSWHAAVAVE